jgi:hypothetical protein
MEAESEVSILIRAGVVGIQIMTGRGSRIRVGVTPA